MNKDLEYQVEIDNEEELNEETEVQQHLTEADVVQAAMLGNKEGFIAAFNDIIANKISNALDVKKMDVASNFLAQQEEEFVPEGDEEEETQDDFFEDDALDSVVEEEVEQIDEIDRTQPAPGRDCDIPFPKAKPIKLTDKQRSQSELMTKQLAGFVKKNLKVKEEVEQIDEAPKKPEYEPKWKVTYDVLSHDPKKKTPLYSTDADVRAKSSSEAIRTIKDIFGEKNHRAQQITFRKKAIGRLKEEVEQIDEDYKAAYNKHMAAHMDAAEAGNWDKAEMHAKKAESAAAKHFKLTGKKIIDAGYTGNSKYIASREVDSQNLRDQAVRSKDPAVIAAALKHKDPEVRGYVIHNNDHATSKHVAMVIRDKDPEVRIGAVVHKNATKEHVAMGIRDKHPEVRAAAATHSKASTEDLMHLARNDKDEDVRTEAKSALKHRGVSFKKKAISSVQEALKRTVKFEKGGLTPYHYHVYDGGVKIKVKEPAPDLKTADKHMRYMFPDNAFRKLPFRKTPNLKVAKEEVEQIDEASTHIAYLKPKDDAPDYAKDHFNIPVSSANHKAAHEKFAKHFGRAMAKHYQVVRVKPKGNA